MTNVMGVSLLNHSAVCYITGSIAHRVGGRKEIEAPVSALFALFAAVLTSLLPICQKDLLRSAPPTLVAWIVNAASLPLLALGTLALTQCTLDVSLGYLAAGCRWHPPLVHRVFALALLASAVLNWAATLLATKTLAQADASLVSTLLTFNPGR